MRFRFALLRGSAALAGLALVTPFLVAAPGASRPMELEDLFRLHRVTDPQLSPDGRLVAYVVTDPLKEENRTNSDIWVASADGSGTPRRLTSSPRHDRRPRWSPDGKWLAFESTRDGESQIFLLPLNGGEPKKLTHLALGAATAVWSPDGKSIAFTSEVYPEFSNRPFAEMEKANREKQDARDKSKVKARFYEELFYRRWDAWTEGKRTHLFLVGVNADGGAVSDPRDLTPGANDGVPNSSTFSADVDFAFSPDGREIVTTVPPMPTREQAWTTNYDLWTINLQTGEKQNLTTGNPAADGLPSFSPDGHYFAYRAQRVAGFEADRWEIWLVDRKTSERRALTEKWDRSVGNFIWAPDSKTLWIESQEAGTEPIYRLDLVSGNITVAVTGGVNSNVAVSPDGRSLTFLRQFLTRPAEVARWTLGEAQPAWVTKTNADLLAPIAFTPPETVTVTAAGGASVQMWIVKPPHFDPAKKYPLVFWVHGGPQSAWLDSWSTRWNAEIWAAQGYVLAMPNPRGSSGFGQQFTNEISRDWGGKVFDDLLACLAYIKQQPYIDTTHMAAAGASYGGYMMNWFQGHVREFRCIVNHDGVFNFNTMYNTTDELWFDEHEHGQPGEPDFEKFSPHRFTAAWSTPMLIVHNELDFRCPISEGMAAFTTLQRKGIRSKILIFPDEGHWVLKPQNSELWHNTVFQWLGEYLKAP